MRRFLPQRRAHGFGERAIVITRVRVLERRGLEVETDGAGSRQTATNNELNDHDPGVAETPGDVAEPPSHEIVEHAQIKAR